MMQLIERITPQFKDLFELEFVDRQNEHDLYILQSRGDKVLLQAGSKSAMACGYYRFLTDYCDMNLSPCGNTEVYASDVFRLPEQPVTEEIPQDVRVSMTYETYTTDAYCWDFDRWSLELDYLAMQGVNAVPMLVGYEAALYYGALEIGINREDAMEFLSGPCYFPFQIAGKLDTVFPMTDTNYLKAQIALGKKIVERMREVGIEPILPTFNGHAAKYMKGYFSNSDLFFVTPFGNYPFTYRFWPQSPVFSKFGAAIDKKMTEYFGEAKYYLADPFLGVSPRTHEAGLMESYGKRIAESIRENHPGAVWVSHACDHTMQLIADADAESVLILDTDGTFAEKTGGFGGKPYVSGTRLNFGGHTVLSGNLEKLCENAFLQNKKNYPNVCGAGVFSEYTLSNPIFTACAYRMLTSDKELNPDDIFTKEALLRWGGENENLRSAAEILRDTCYGKDSPTIAVGSVIAARPSTELSHTSAGDTLLLHYDNKLLCSAVEQMLLSTADYTDGYVFDVCDMTRQMLSNYARRLYVGVMEGYQKRDGRLFETSTNAFLRVLSDLDDLMQTRSEFCLQSHMTDAVSRADGNTNQQNFEISFLASVTMFGPFREPDCYDLLWKEWGGLLNTYYAVRWHEFFEMLAEGFKKRKNISTVCRKQVDGRNPCTGNKFYKALDKKERHWITTCAPKAKSDADTLELAAELVKKYKPMIERDYIQ